MIEPLPIAFRKAERIYRQLARDRFVALYEVKNVHHVLIGFELIIVRIQNARVVNYKQSKVSFPARERYPHNSEFGRFAWSLPISTRNLAELLFDQLATSQPKLPKSFGVEDLMRFGYPREGPNPNTLVIRNFVTGRPLPKHPRCWRDPIKFEHEVIDPAAAD